GANRRFLQLVDLFVDALERETVARPEVPSAADVGDVLEQRVVNLHGTILVAQPEHAAPHGHGGHAFAAHADGVDAYAQRGRRVGRGARINGPAIVHTIGE